MFSLAKRSAPFDRTLIENGTSVGIRLLCGAVIHVSFYKTASSAPLLLSGGVSITSKDKSTLPALPPKPSFFLTCLPPFLSQSSLRCVGTLFSLSAPLPSNSKLMSVLKEKLTSILSFRILTFFFVSLSQKVWLCS